MVVAGGKPAIAYFSSADNEVRVAVSQSESPAGSSDWVTYGLSPAEDREISIFAYPDRLGICFWQGGLVYAESDQLSPDGPEDWQLHVVTAENGYGLSAISYGGLAHIGYCAGGPVRLARAIVASPDAPTDWQLQTVDDPVYAAAGVSLAEVNGLLAACYFLPGTDELAYARATVAVPTAADDWVRQLVNDVVGYDISDLVVINGKPAVLCSDYSGLYLSRALTVDPTYKGDWVTSVVDSEAKSYTCSGAVLDSRLVVCYEEGNDSYRNRLVQAAVAQTAEPDDEADWTIEVICRNQSYATRIGRLIQAGDALSLCFYQQASNDFLMFASWSAD